MFVVARSHLHYQGVYVVEIETRGLDNLSPGVLCPKYPGELQEYADPREAVETAIKIRDAWIKDGTEVEGITFGTTHGGMFEPEVFDGSDDELKQEALERWEKLPKCDRCGDVLNPGETYQVFDPALTDERFCSDNCASMALDDYNKQVCQTCGNEVPEGREYYCSDECEEKAG